MSYTPKEAQDRHDAIERDFDTGGITRSEAELQHLYVEQRLNGAPDANVGQWSDPHAPPPVIAGDDYTRDELLDMAAERNVVGRSGMNKDELSVVLGLPHELSVLELRELASERDIEGRSSLNKEELEEALRVP